MVGVEDGVVTFSHFDWMKKTAHRDRYFKQGSTVIVHPDVGVGHRPSKRVVRIPDNALLLKEMWETALAHASDEQLVPETATM